jgi:hypothetical protein
MASPEEGTEEAAHGVMMRTNSLEDGIELLPTLPSLPVETTPEQEEGTAEGTVLMHSNSMMSPVGVDGLDPTVPASPPPPSPPPAPRSPWGEGKEARKSGELIKSTSFFDSPGSAKIKRLISGTVRRLTWTSVLVPETALKRNTHWSWMGSFTFSTLGIILAIPRWTDAEAPWLPALAWTFLVIWLGFTVAYFRRFYRPPQLRFLLGSVLAYQIMCLAMSRAIVSIALPDPGRQNQAAPLSLLQLAVSCCAAQLDAAISTRVEKVASLAAMWFMLSYSLLMSLVYYDDVLVFEGVRWNNDTAEYDGAWTKQVCLSLPPSLSPSLSL